MKVKVWGARGSIPAPGPETTRYGGNTSCVQVTLDDGSTLVLDAGTGIRTLGLALQPHAERPAAHPAHPPAPGPHPGADVLRARCSGRSRRSSSGARPRPRPRCATASRATSRRRWRRSRSASCPATCRSARPSRREWKIGPARIRAASVTHRGPTLGYRIEADGTLALLHPRPRARARRPARRRSSDEWISGFDLAQRRDLLIHDCQYTDEEYPDHLGWGHSPLTDALAFASRTDAERLLLFHHDPLHSDDFLDAFAGRAASPLGGAGRPRRTRSSWRPSAARSRCRRRPSRAPDGAQRSRRPPVVATAC